MVPRAYRWFLKLVDGFTKLTDGILELTDGFFGFDWRRALGERTNASLVLGGHAELVDVIGVQALGGVRQLGDGHLGDALPLEETLDALLQQVVDDLSATVVHGSRPRHRDPTVLDVGVNRCAGLAGLLCKWRHVTRGGGYTHDIDYRDKKNT